MKRTHTVLMSLLAMSLVLAPAALLVAQEEAETDDKAAIVRATRDYIDGWYEGNAERMERALHPDLTKRRVNQLPNGRGVLHTLSADQMVEFTRLGGGTKDRQEGQKNEVIILDVSSHTASVKTISPQFIDYLHLAKVNGRWRIVNVLWEPTKK